jgi:predicted choloylglycine hydrolase
MFSFTLRIVLLFLATFSLFPVSPLWCCTIFNKTQGNGTLVGNNEDWRINTSYVKFLPASGDKFGRVFFGFGENCRYVFGGVNDKGLFYDIASLSRREIDFEPNKKTIDNEIYERMLEKCRTLDEAISFLNQFNIKGLKRHHIMVVDRKGNSAIIEWGSDCVEVLRKTGDFQVTTNFTNSNPGLAGWYPCRRFSTATEMLRRMTSLNVDAFAAILRAVHNPGDQYPTVYSNVYDLAAMLVYVYYNHNFDEYVTFDIHAELSADQHVFFLPGLFSRLRMLAPTDDQLVSTDKVTLAWEGAAKKYQVYCSTDSLFRDAAPAEVVADSSTLAGLAPQSFGILFCLLLFVKFLRKKSLVLFAIMICFQMLSCLGKFETPVVSRHSITLETLRPARYYWKVVAYNAEGRQSQSVVKTFVVRA